MPSNAHIVGYIVFNRRTNRESQYATGAAASRACDRMDKAYGAVCTTRRAVWSDQPESIRFTKHPIPLDPAA